MRGLVRKIVCALVLLGLTAHSSTEAACSTTRIRKSYDSLTAAEKALYLSALQLAMDKGYYIKFVEMHTEKMSEMQAHRVCTFSYWHRYLLLGFENMLRGLGTAYQCITVPYWDEIQHNAKLMAGTCSSIQGCSPIVADLGGSTVGTAGGITINGAFVNASLCVNQAPLNHFCQASSKTGTACAKCVPRENLLKKTFPAASTYSSVYTQLFSPVGFVASVHAIEYGIHNSIHATMMGAMGYLQSPADPLFWSHHANIDMIQSIYYKCRIGFGKLSAAQMQNNPYSFVTCPYRDATGNFTASSTVTTRTGEDGVNPVQASTSGSVLYPFFNSINTTFAHLCDISMLGPNQYSYQVQGLIGQLATSCQSASSTARRLDAQEAKPAMCESELAGGESVDPFIVKPTAQDDVESTTKTNDWIVDVTEQLNTMEGGGNDTASAQLEKMVCMFFDQCRGGVEDYPEAFKLSFGVTEPPACKVIVDKLNSPNVTDCEKIKLPNWKETMTKYFPCKVSDYAV